MPSSCPGTHCIKGPILRTLSAISKHKADTLRHDGSHFRMTFCSTIGSAAGFGAIHYPILTKPAIHSFIHWFAALGSVLAAVEPFPSKGMLSLDGARHANSMCYWVNLY